MVTFEIDGQRITLNNIDPFHLLILLGDKVDKNIIYNIAKPDFTIVVRPSYKPNFKTKEGDYDIIIRKDSGEEIALDMPHRGAKALYVLTLLSQKVVGGLSNKFFENSRAAAAIIALYDKLYRSGGGQWVEKCASKNHNLSTFRTHAKDAVEKNKALDNVLRYWCGFEDEKYAVGKKQLNLKRIRIPNDRIIFEDAAKSQVFFEEIMEQMPPLEELFGFRNKTTECLKQLCSQKAANNYSQS